jgi:hypothetical protein
VLNDLVGKAEVKRPLGKPGRRWVTSIKMGLQETGWQNLGWINIESSGRLF